MKNEIISKLVLTPADDRIFDRIDKMMTGPEDSRLEIEPDLGLSAVAKLVGYHPTWLRRLKVPELCGQHFGGRYRYRLGDVQAYLSSQGCRDRISELRKLRKYTVKPRA